jgi:hypothetical protein
VSPDTTTLTQDALCARVKADVVAAIARLRLEMNQHANHVYDGTTDPRCRLCEQRRWAEATK